MTAPLVEIIDPANSVELEAGGLSIEIQDGEFIVELSTERAGLTIKHISDLQLSYVSASTIQIARGEALSSQGDLGIFLQSTRNVNIEVAGANGLDTGAEAADTWYFVYVISDSMNTNAVAGLISESSTAPTLPTGYDRFRRIGSFRNNPTSDIIEFTQYGVSRDRMVHYLTIPQNRQPLLGGSATIVTAVSCASFIPPITRKGILTVRQLGTPVAFLFESATKRIYAAVSSEAIVGVYPVDVTQSMHYLNFGPGGNLDVTVDGYLESL